MTNNVSESALTSICSLGHCQKRKGRLLPRAGACTDIGSVRDTNDDVVFAGDDCRLYVALDGIGGHAGGAKASRIVLDKLRASIESMCASATSHPDQGLRAAVTAALGEATREMLKVAEVRPEFDRMGTVFALAYIVDDTLLYTHVGDSRVYLVRRGRVKQLTSDETYVQLMVDVGVIEPDDVRDHPLRNVVLNSVSTRSTDGDPIVHSKRLRPGDVVLLTTDGVSDVLKESDLARLVGENSEPGKAANAIVHAAIDSGSRDNASCVVIMSDRAQRTGCSKRDDLHFELTKLHDMLSEVDAMDQELRHEMVQLSEDIRKALHQNETSKLATLGSELNERALSFEVSHPNLSSAVVSITNLLASIGI